MPNYYNIASLLEPAVKLTGPCEIVREVPALILRDFNSKSASVTREDFLTVCDNPIDIS